MANRSGPNSTPFSVAGLVEPALIAKTNFPLFTAPLELDEELLELDEELDELEMEPPELDEELPELEDELLDCGSVGPLHPSSEIPISINAPLMSGLNCLKCIFIEGF